MDEKKMADFIITIASVVLGFILGQSAEFIKDIKKNRERKKSVKQLVELELNKNKDLLTDYWLSVSKKEKSWFDEKNKFRFIKLAYAINDVPFPRLSRIVWDNSINTIPSIYKNEEIKNIWETFESYDLLLEIREHLFSKENEAQDAGIRAENRINRSGGGGIMSNLLQSMHFSGDASVYAEKFKNVIENVIGKNVIEFVNQSKA